MKIVDFVLHPGTLLVLAGGGIAAGAGFFSEYYWSNRQGTDGLVLGLFVFASAALIAAVVRRAQLRNDG